MDEKLTNWLYVPGATPAKELSKHDQKMIHLGWDAHRTLPAVTDEKFRKELMEKLKANYKTEDTEALGIACETEEEFNGRVADQIEALFTTRSEDIKKAERERLGDIFRGWLISDVSDGELAKAFGVCDSDWKQLFGEKQATFNSYCGSLIDECEYPFCQAKQALNGGR